MATRAFYLYGKGCSSHPWEVIVATLTLTICVVTIDHHQAPVPPSSNKCCTSEYNALDMIVMTIIRCFVVLYCYYQFITLKKLGSLQILGIAGLFVVFSSFIFTSMLLNIFHINLSDLKDALFLFLLPIDFSKTTVLARLALNANNEGEIKLNIAKGISLLGPGITLDMIVETLLIGIGTLSGIPRMETLSYFACLSVIVNYVVFMTFYPACLSLILELSRSSRSDKTFINLPHAILDSDFKPNPIVQRVKIIMFAGLAVVHGISRWPINENQPDNALIQDHVLYGDVTSFGYVLKKISSGAEYIVVLILSTALSIKFIYFENPDVTNMPLVNVTHKSVQCVTEQTHRHTQVDKSDEDTDDDPVNKSETSSLKDEDIIKMVKNKNITMYQIEKTVRNPKRAVDIRRRILSEEGNLATAMKNLPFNSYDYKQVFGVCCENVIGYIPVPLGLVGPLKLDGQSLYVPLATTEGALVASVSRGSRAVAKNGITSRVVSDGMTRGPVTRFPSAIEAGDAMSWIQDPNNFALVKTTFDSTSRFASLIKLNVYIAGRYLFIRFVAKTGDAMGMNMLSKGTEEALKVIQAEFPSMDVLSVSGNVCVDKKPSAMNWIEGRGKSVVCEAIIPSGIVTSVLKTNVARIIDVNISKNLIGSAIGGSIGGCNAHAANIVTAIFIAAGQDPAQNVVSSNCMTLMEPWGENGEDLYMSCSMPSLEVGTIGGGTSLSAQSACLEIMGVKGGSRESPGDNANQLAKIICGTVLAGELSLMAALTEGHLVKSHLKHNRSNVLSTSI